MRLLLLLATAFAWVRSYNIAARWYRENWVANRYNDAVIHRRIYGFYRGTIFCGWSTDSYR